MFGRKITQIISIDHNVILGLCNDGSIWRGALDGSWKGADLDFHIHWMQVNGIPEDSGTNSTGPK